MPPDKELDGVHECKREEGEGGSDEVEEGEGGEDQVRCQLVVLRVTVRRKLSIGLQAKQRRPIPKSQFCCVRRP